MEKIKTLRGFRDISGEELDRLSASKAVSRKYLQLLNFTEIEIPILEKTELFVRSIGDTTDIVEKEMFTFIDIGGIPLPCVLRQRQDGESVSSIGFVCQRTGE